MRPTLTLRRAMIGVAIMAVVSACALWLDNQVSLSREAARRVACIGNLKCLVTALLNYESAHGAFPPAVVRDANGNPLYSWRVLLLREIESSGGSLSGFRFDEPWNSPNNTKFHHLRPSAFVCPSVPRAAATGASCYALVVGPHTLFPPDGAPRALAQVTDGPRNTIALLETTSLDSHWMAPGDLDWYTMSVRFNDPARPCPSSPHRLDSDDHSHVSVALLDGSVRGLCSGTGSNALKSMLTIDQDDHPDETAAAASHR